MPRALPLSRSTAHAAFGAFALAAAAVSATANAQPRSSSPTAPRADPQLNEPAPRPPPLPPLETTLSRWERHLEIGGDVVVGARPAAHDASGSASGIRYLPAVGFGLHARWQILEYLRFSTYFADLHHHLRVPTGSLGLPGASYDFDTAKTFVLGLRLAPTLPLGERARAWVSLGAGWGRFEIGRTQVTLPSQTADSTLHEQAFSFVEIPVGIGASFDLVKHWLSFDVELTGAALTGQRGDALDGRQLIDSHGSVRHTTGFPVLDASFMQTVGLSLLL